jgi:hypothetical protein
MSNQHEEQTKSEAPRLKLCLKCRIEKPADQFYYDRSAPNGKRSRCETCQRADQRSRRAANPEKARDSVRRWREANREKARERDRLRYAADAEKYRKLVRQWERLNPEKKRARHRVLTAKRNGSLTPQVCEVCGAGKTHGHHPDYSKPLEVRWLCAKHHRLEHIIWKNNQN